MPTPIFSINFNSYIAQLSQSGTDAPTAEVLVNDLGGAVTLGRTSTGIYTLTKTGAFTAKTSIIFPSNGAKIFSWVRTSTNVITIQTKTLDVGGGTLALADDLLVGELIHILVYI